MVPCNWIRITSTPAAGLPVVPLVTVPLTVPARVGSVATASSAKARPAAHIPRAGALDPFGPGIVDRNAPAVTGQGTLTPAIMSAILFATRPGAWRAWARSRWRYP